MRVHALQDTGKPFGFLLVTAPRTYRIFGSSKPEQQEWMTAIKTAKADFNKRKVEAARRAEVRVPPRRSRRRHYPSQPGRGHVWGDTLGEHPRGHADAARRSRGLPPGLGPSGAQRPVR